ncbi:MAG: hypothetical protein A3G47_02145 [Candidatus Zambryskibacteria bacterium RIFCSPLOWO2_12_FULL_39_45]|uniref:Uncharacterized protein n=3 Tax=Candidatus Zambryskiibacteriota TaxID=1817925 RepID=A0A1G2T8T1_9BACT|nr:MAG: hypothetical protein UT81_C0014G0017 [Parcubacteria group bacterium GW2011_GWA2_40_14]OHA93169.1 MAG: hypothetical protein A2W58_03000 [Candidatus Zambryskibacteria bacterium RIFCSPHIGHO2_02_38_10.5]OHA97471.1 MAG: hypothetical protein A3E32_00290 [Candidatus Zambryskibacteria bacterium RIFCSPHIGHO2_12_FULL_38_37]OHB07985.1 MAG: hypothetical protein A2W64_00985 [Candidatus Zambryskibacteria bacterium RIFCSPLOWO2_02_39_10]OHB09585.1 MAG: hypothetical protein A3I21_00275 [Candidatus Zambr
MNNRQTIHDILNDWGKSKQRSPESNDSMKSMVLNKLPNNSVKTFKTPTPLPWLSFAFTTMAILVVMGNSVNYSTKTLITPNYTTSSSDAMESSAQSKNSIMPDYYPRYGYPGESPISDGREFLKTHYNSTLRTRHVTNTKTRIETIVRGFGGRIDGSSSAERYGYIGFALPANKLELFRQEIKDIFGEKLYIEQISTENLLPQKQSIEAEQTQTEKYITGLKSERNQVINSHNSTATSLQSKINAINTEITRLEIENQTATQQRKTEISTRIAELQTEKNTIQGQLGTENKSYQNKLANIDSQLKNWQSNLEVVKKQDKNLIESVATVNGSISLSWISLWEMSDIYTPGPLLAWILLALATIAYFYHRRYLELAI